MATYSLMGDTISNSAGNGPPTFPFGINQPAVVKDIADQPYVITNTDGFSFVTSTVTLTSNRAVTLPSAVNNIGRQIKFKKMDTSTLAIQVVIPGGDTLDGFTNAYSLSNSGATLAVVAVAAGKWTIVEVAKVAPTMTKLISGTTYNVPAYVSSLNIKMVGGGAGGAGGGSAAGTSGTNGQTTTFGTWLSANGGLYTPWANAMQPGATGTINAPATGSVFIGSLACGAGNGTSGGAANNGSNGAASPFGGNGSGGGIGTPTTAAAANSGSGGGGGYSGNGGNPVAGIGGGAGCYIEATIPASALGSTVTYAIGSAGSGGGSGTGGAAGLAGGAGCILVTEIYT